MSGEKQTQQRVLTPSKASGDKRHALFLSQAGSAEGPAWRSFTYRGYMISLKRAATLRASVKSSADTRHIKGISV